MAHSPLGDIEELALCSCCKRAFDDAERPPKLLACKHHFCLACTSGVLGAGREVYCMHCWKRTDLPDGRADRLPTHAAVLALARLAAPEPACAARACRADRLPTHAAVLALARLAAPEPACAARACRADRLPTHAAVLALARLAAPEPACAARACRADRLPTHAAVLALARLAAPEPACAARACRADRLPTHAAVLALARLAAPEPACAARACRADRLPTHAAVLALARLAAPEPACAARACRADRLPTHAAVLALARLAAPEPACAARACRADRLPTHAAVLALARLAAPEPACAARACRACPPHEARALLARETRELLRELARLAGRRRDLLLRALGAATAMKLRLEAELAAPTAPLASAEPRSLPAAAAERDRLRARHAEALVQARLDDLVRSASVPVDFELLRRALTAGPAHAEPAPGTWAERDPLLLLGNYCTAQLFTRQWAGGEVATEGEVAPGASPGASASSASAVASPLPRMPSAFPLFYFELEADGAACGRVLVEVRDDVAPRMARNFAVLASGELGVGYRGCSVFQCWENESVITGDFELNNGRGGRYFMPDDTRLAAVRGAVGMRRSQKRHDNLGLVGSQFRIVLREMRGFTAIFASVVEGLELVGRLSRAGDSAGKPHSTIIISSCGKLN